MIDYDINIRNANTELIALKNGNLFDRKYIDKKDTVEWSRKLLNKKYDKDIAESVIVACRLFKPSRIRLRSNSD